MYPSSIVVLLLLICAQDLLETWPLSLLHCLSPRQIVFIPPSTSFHSSHVLPLRTYFRHFQYIYKRGYCPWNSPNLILACCPKDYLWCQYWQRIRNLSNAWGSCRVNLWLYCCFDKSRTSLFSFMLDASWIYLCVVLIILPSPIKQN